MNLWETDTVVVGHPFAPVGMGEQMRSAVAAMTAAYVPTKVLDVFKYSARIDSDHRMLIEPLETAKLGEGVRIFHMNGNEIEPVLKHLAEGGHNFEEGYNVIVPAWELPFYPAEWGKLVNRFDEVWAISQFVKESLSRSNIEAHHVSQNVEIPMRPFLPRRYFGIRESAFVMLHFFDLTSFAKRKNPEATVELFNRLRRSRPYDDLQLVLKVKDGDSHAEDWIAPNLEYPADTLVLRKPLSTYETHSLINCCDCLVSLHRSEGFGRGTGEAMFLGRLAIATGWSGNLDYMTDDNSLLINYSLVAPEPDAYPFAEGQYWAEPDIDHAFALMRRVIDNPDIGRRIAAFGRRDVMRLVGARPVGLAMADRIRNILRSREKLYARHSSDAKHALHSPARGKRNRRSIKRRLTRPIRSSSTTSRSKST